MPLSPIFLGDESGSFMIPVSPKDLFVWFLGRFWKLNDLVFPSQLYSLCEQTPTPKMRTNWECLVGFHGREVNFGGSQGSTTNVWSDPEVSLCRGAGPLSAKLPTQTVLAKPRKWDYFFCVPGTLERVLHAKPRCVQGQRASFIHSSAPAHTSATMVGLRGSKENFKPCRTPGNSQISEKFTH